MSERQKIFETPLSDLFEEAAADPSVMESWYGAFTNRYLSIGQLGVERNTFIGWRSKGLMPFLDKESNGESNDSEKDKSSQGGWRRFSFVEGVWIRCVQEMRALGLSIQKIKEVADVVWPKEAGDVYDRLLPKLSLAQPENPFYETFTRGVQEHGEAAAREAVGALGLNYLFFFVLGSFFQKARYLLVVNKWGEVSFVPLTEYTQGMDPEILKLQTELFTTSCTVVNLWSVMEDLAFTVAVELPESVLLLALSEAEQQILEAMRGKQYQEIIIQADREGEPTTIRLKKIGIDEKAVKKLHTYLKKGEFKSVHFKTKDGQLIQFEETEVIKLQPKRGRGRPRKVTK